MEPKRILVVDDERDLCEILRYNLKASGFEVEVAYSGEEALQLIENQPVSGNSYDMILLDVMMPGMSGFALARHLKSSDSSISTIPIIFLTAKDAEGDVLDGFYLGADDYITKPFSIREVLARVRAVLNRSTLLKEKGVFVYHGLEVNLDLKSASIDGESLPLTKTEFDLLTLLISNRGRVFSRKELLERVWKRGVVVTNRTVDVNITRMRKKIGRYSSCVVTRQGFGYVFEDRIDRKF